MSRQRAEKGACANAPGRSRGGYEQAPDAHPARRDNEGLPLGFILTGEASDYTVAEPPMSISVAAPEALLADTGYDDDRFRESLLIRVSCRSSRLARTARFPNIPTIAATGTASRACSES
ncbi:hypothetical protein [Croceicoccus hydrothermalis]|uniref:hypothetical protein n=1 Tax=Croceicoccus hydrothermalis TaxID=2867964 RepID=UPI001EFBE8D9|nr:hypothetical protein [Croceicoccus hydrothermalis]